MSKNSCCVYLSNKLAAYGFGDEHPFGPQRHHVFEQAFYKQGLDQKVDILEAVTTDQQHLELFHTHEYIQKVIEQSKFGVGYLDNGDTPAFTGMFEAARYVAGSVLDAIDQLMASHYKTAFIPIAGLHHARRHIAAGFSGATFESTTCFARNRFAGRRSTSRGHSCPSAPCPK